VAGLSESLHREHEHVYGHADREAPVQIINLRLVIVGESPKPRFPPADLVDADARPERHIEVYVDGEVRDVALYFRDDLAPGQRFAGPCVIAQSDCTTKQSMPRTFSVISTAHSPSLKVPTSQPPSGMPR